MFKKQFFQTVHNRHKSRRIAVHKYVKKQWEGNDSIFQILSNSFNSSPAFNGDYF